MSPDLSIVNDSNPNVVSVATYKSLYSLLRLGFNFRIVGTKFGDPVPTPVIEQMAIVEQELKRDTYIAPELPIFNQPKKRVMSEETKKKISESYKRKALEKSNL
jgi:hypothetical protein